MKLKENTLIDTLVCTLCVISLHAAQEEQPEAKPVLCFGWMRVSLSNKEAVIYSLKPHHLNPLNIYF